MRKELLGVITIIMTILTSSCGANSLKRDEDVLVKYLQGSSKDSFTRQMDMNDLRGCPILINQVWRGYNHKYGAGASQTWFDGRMLTETGISLDILPDDKSYIFMSNSHKDYKNSSLVYIGPWMDIEFKSGPIWNEKITKKTIRMFSAQLKSSKYDSDPVWNFYESMDDKNKNIPQMPLKLIKKAEGDGLCTLKWHAKFGYNGVAEVKSKNTFSKNYLVPTGRIIDSETGKITETKD